MDYKTLRKKITTNIFTYNEVREQFSEERPEYTKIQLSRLIKSGNLISIKKGIYAFYQTNLESISYELGAICAYPNAYITAESVIVKHGYSENAYLQEFKSKVDLDDTSYLISNMRIDPFNFAGKRYKFSNIKSNLYFGYHKRFSSVARRYYLEASIEKAILDYLYLRRPNPMAVEEVNISSPHKFSFKKYEKFAEKFDKLTQSYTPDVIG